MSFELINVLITYQNIINNTLREYLNIIVVIYLNNILMFSKTLNEHTKHIKQILKILYESNFLLKLKKCEFYKQEVYFCEFKIKIIKIKINFDKLKLIRG